MLVKKVLGDEATDYIQDVLNYDSYLCRLLNEHFAPNRHSGESFAYLPETLDIKSIGDFRHGGVYSTAAEYLPDYLVTKAYSQSSRLLIFDDVMAEQCDDHGEELGAVCVLRDGEVYRGVEAGATDEASLRKIIWATAVSWHFLCVVTIPALELSLEQFLGTDGEDGRADAVSEIVVGAFDGEGFLHFTYPEV